MQVASTHRQGGIIWGLSFSSLYQLNALFEIGSQNMKQSSYSTTAEGVN